MAGGRKRNRTHIPRSRRGENSGDPTPADAQSGDYSRARLEDMDRRFCLRLTNALADGMESLDAARGITRR